MKDITISTAYYSVSETKPSTPHQYPPDSSVWLIDPPSTEETVWSTLATVYSDGTFEYSEVIINGEDTTPSIAPELKTYYKTLPIGSDAPPVPTDNPPTGWAEEKQIYDPREYDEYSVTISTYDDGTFEVSEPQLGYKPEYDDPVYDEEPETFFYYIVVENGADEPSVPTTNPPPSPWVDTEPEYDYVAQDLYSIAVSVYSDGTFEYEPVRKEVAPEEVTLEFAAGNGVYYSDNEPAGGEYNDGDVWFCTAPEGDNAGGIFIYNKNEDGTGSWIAHQIGTVSVKDGSITADKIVVNDVFARLVLSKDIVATGKITATNLNITGDSTFSGTLNGATGTFTGAIEANGISVYTTPEAGYKAGLGVTKSQDPEAPAGYFEVTLGVLQGNAWHNYLQLDNDGAGFSGNLNVGGALTAKSVNGYTLAAACSRGVKTQTTVGTLGWGTNNNYLADINMLSYWNGAYTGTYSNLKYCANGEMIGTNNLSSKLPAAAPGTKGCAQMISGMLTPGTVSAGGYLDYPYTFTSGTFSGTPTIVACTIESDAGTSASGNAARKVIVKSRSTTSVTFRLYNNSSSSWSPKIAYIGIYRG